MWLSVRCIDTVADYFFNKYEWDFRYDDSAKWQLIEDNAAQDSGLGRWLRSGGNRVL